MMIALSRAQDLDQWYLYLVNSEYARSKQTKWSAAEVDAMTVPKLKAALKKEKQPVDGRKADLKSRLLKFLGFPAED